MTKVCWLFAALTSPLWADISGFVRDAMDNPIAGARVRVQAHIGEPVISGADGSFTLSLSGGTDLKITAAVAYDPLNPVNYLSNGVTVDDGSSGVVIRLDPIPDEENTGYFPIKARSPDGCGDCHPLQLAAWELSRHADTAQNSWVNDLYADWSARNPGRTGFCASCHAPAADSQDPGNVFLDQLDSLPLLDRLSAQEGVNCSSCHQIDHVNNQFEAMHLNGNATMRFPLDGIGGSGTHEYVWGPLDDVDYLFMKSVYSPQFAQSELCASCHEYNNPFTEAPGQSTYSEWLDSPYSDPGGGLYAACQDCHMPAGSGSSELCDPPIGLGSGPLRSPVSRGNHQIEGTTQLGLATAVDLSWQATVDDGQLRVTVSVANTGAGHAFPTGVSVRNVILRLLATGTDGAELLQSSGETVPFYGSDYDGTTGEGDWAGLPGKGFARVLRDDSGNKPVLFIDATAVDSDTRIPADETDTSSYSFDLNGQACNGGNVRVDLLLSYRRAWRGTVVAMGWTTDARGLPWELELKNVRASFDFFQLSGAMWAQAPATGFDSDGDERMTVLDLLAHLGCAP